jgi:hypothetical protein
MVSRGRAQGGGGGVLGQVGIETHVGKMASRIWVRKKSATMMKTDDQTTA